MDIKKIAEGFGISTEDLSFDECTIGHINSTFFVKTGASAEVEYVFQKINTSIFKKPDELMSNVFKVTEHISKKLKEENDTLSTTLFFLKTKNGEPGLDDGEGGYWRVYRYVRNAHSLNGADSPEVFEKSGYAFGNFQRLLADFDASVLYETIPNFHNTVSRLNDFKTALDKNLANRRDSITEDIAFVLDRADKCSYVTDGIADGRFPLRVTHNDTKLNNLLWDNETEKCICVIDLDTVMPGSVLYDFGDSIRFGASSAAEDETDLSKVYVCLDKYEAYVKGFISGTNGALTSEELLAFPMGAYVITFETGIRFLTDYLNGDTYFRTHYPSHNLDRARNQFKLVKSLEEKMDELNAIMKKYVK